jgi:hypothetical protein
MLHIFRETAAQCAERFETVARFFIVVRAARWFIHKNPDLGKFWSALDRKLFMAIYV